MTACPLGARYGEIVQMSYVTHDMDAAVAHAQAELGIAGMARSSAEIEVLSYGEKRSLSVRSAIANIGNRQFEIIEPIAGAIEIYDAAMGDPGQILRFHHIGIAVPGAHARWMQLLDEVRRSGDPFAYLFPAEPSPDDKLCFCYVDTRQRIGHFTEYLWADPSLKGAPVAPWL